MPKIQEIQRRLTALGFDTGGADGRIGLDTTLAARNFQRKTASSPPTAMPAWDFSPGCVKGMLVIRLDAATGS